MQHDFRVMSHNAPKWEEIIVWKARENEKRLSKV